MLKRTVITDANNVGPSRQRGLADILQSLSGIKGELKCEDVGTRKVLVIWHEGEPDPPQSSCEEFIKERLEKGEYKKDCLLKREVLSAYVIWCERHRLTPVSPTKLNSALRSTLGIRDSTCREGAKTYKAWKWLRWAPRIMH